MAKVYFYYAAMNAGKSTALLQANHNYLERGMRTMLFTTAIDDRDGANAIVSRIGIRTDARTFAEGDDLLAIVGGAHEKESLDCVLIDEAQFLSKDQVFQLGRIADELNVPVLAFGLRTDFRGELFEGSKYLLAWGDDLKEIKTICHCGKKATMVARIDASGKQTTEGAQVEIGGNERYVSLCRNCFRSGSVGAID
ncbi:MAG: thymidine kinase [Opitutae bacterium]|nr:thymidine kinase [Opitutae bacterium]|tara:strand:+ start:2378 stop:2965 length:588 start_codon:yes stop_codon:yes gene_type:complete